MSQTIFRLTVPVIFPHGIAPGEGRDKNHLVLARDGNNKPILRGSSIAGALRHAWSTKHGSGSASKFFGTHEQDKHRPSPLTVCDAKFDAVTGRRTHVGIDRHTGAAIDGSLFTIEQLPPGVTTTFVFVLKTDATTGDESNITSFVEQIVGLIAGGLTFGAAAARGIGRVALDESKHKPRFRSFNVSNLSEHCDWLNEQALLARGEVPTTGEVVSTTQSNSSDLTIEVAFAIPRGQDFVIGDGHDIDHSIEPQRCIDAKGSEVLRLPGSSLRGIFRAWCSRLAAKDKLSVIDNSGAAQRRAAQGEELRGEWLGWGGKSGDERKQWQDDPTKVTCPIMQLFGSLYSKGRIHFTDATVTLDNKCLSSRHHVSIDRFTGGASDGFLFTTQVVTAAANKPFVTTVTLKSPSDKEVEWIGKTLRAIDMGILRVGSSKAAGRLGVKIQSVQGAHASILSGIVEKGVTHA